MEISKNLRLFTVSFVALVLSVSCLQVWSTSPPSPPRKKQKYRPELSQEARKKLKQLSLRAAVGMGAVETIEKALQGGANVDTIDTYGNTPLSWAAYEGQIPVMQLLLAHNAHINHANQQGQTPLALALLQGQDRAVFLLLANDAPVPAELYQRMIDLLRPVLSPLNLALIEGDTEAVATILNKMPQVINDAEPFLGMTALDWAAVRGHADLVRLLLDRGADVKVRSTAGNTPLHYAALAGNPDIIESLLRAGAHVNERNNNGDTALHYAARNGHLRAVQVLLRHNALANLFNNQHASAWILAFRNNHPEVADFLERHASELVYGQLTQTGRQAGEFAWAPTPTGQPLPAEIAAIIAQLAMAPGVPPQSGF